jgi:hypothetical protein
MLKMFVAPHISASPKQIVQFQSKNSVFAGLSSLHDSILLDIPIHKNLKPSSLKSENIDWDDIYKKQHNATLWNIMSSFFSNVVFAK